MRRLGGLIAGVSILIALLAAPVRAETARAPAGRSCCRVPAGTMVEVELANAVSTKDQKAGDTFNLRLAAPLIVNGRIVLRAGAPGVGQVVESAKPGLGGKAAKLVLAARYLRNGHMRVPLKALQLSGAGRDNSTAAQAVGLSGIAFAPLGFVGLAVRGGDVTFPAGTHATARVASNMVLPSLGRASRDEAAAAAQSESAAAAASTGAGTIEIAPPPPGKGQVVFFRARSLLGTGQWFNVREGGAALGKLTNGAYFIQITDPGQHDYTAKTEPELKDHLKLEIDPGETYFVEGTLTKGLVIGIADMSPSNRAAFDKASKDLQLAPPPTNGDQPDSADAASAGSVASAAASESADRPSR